MTKELQEYPAFTAIVPLAGKSLGYVWARVPDEVAEQLQMRFETGRASFGQASFDLFRPEEGLVVVEACVRRSVARDFLSIYERECPPPF
jgi:hypothetical protein